jgi:hypothetical protein
VGALMLVAAAPLGCHRSDDKRHRDLTSVTQPSANGLLLAVSLEHFRRSPVALAAWQALGGDLGITVEGGKGACLAEVLKTSQGAALHIDPRSTSISEALFDGIGRPRSETEACFREAIPSGDGPPARVSWLSPNRVLAAESTPAKSRPPMVSPFWDISTSHLRSHPSTILEMSWTPDRGLAKASMLAVVLRYFALHLPLTIDGWIEADDNLRVRSRLVFEKAAQVPQALERLKAVLQARLPKGAEIVLKTAGRDARHIDIGIQIEKSLLLAGRKVAERRLDDDSDKAAALANVSVSRTTH